jgi:putative ABC transport system substrate-binding protein
MKRRDFISLLAGAAVSWPLRVRAQQTMPVIGVLSARAPETDAALLGFFRQGLTQSGYVEGQNVAIEYRGASGDYSRLSALVAELIEHHADVIVTFGGPPSAIAAKSRTTTIPIVFVGGDPVRSGLESTQWQHNWHTLFEDIASKQLALAFELLPQAKMIAILVSHVAYNEIVERDVLKAAQTLGRQVEILKARSISEIETSFERMRSSGADGVLVTVDPFFLTQANRLVAVASRERLPSIFFRREFCEADGLMSYGSSPKEAYVQVGIYAGRILKGAHPADLPIVQSATFELVINLKTAKALGLTVPPMLLACADEVVE